MPWQQVAGEVEDVASVDRPLALQDGLADVIHPVNHHSILGGGRGRRQRLNKVLLIDTGPQRFLFFILSTVE